MCGVSFGLDKQVLFYQPKAEKHLVCLVGGRLPRSRETPRVFGRWMVTKKLKKYALCMFRKWTVTGHSEETRLVCVSRITVNTGSLTQD